MLTDYKVLQKDSVLAANQGISANSGWQEVGVYAAASAEAAVRIAADKKSIAGKYVAIPARFFKPVDVKVETRKVVSLG